MGVGLQRQELIFGDAVLPAAQVSMYRLVKPFMTLRQVVFVCLHQEPSRQLQLMEMIKVQTGI